jgi:A/G-specific adenine glycosylase
VKSLAAADEHDILKLWQGLGYYSRARNLLTAARQVVGEHQGRLPRDHAGLLKLKGVGAYTAAAIASIAFDEAVPVVDGNVYRVLSRVFGIRTPIDSTEGRKEFRELAERLMDPRDPGNYNQALMELGAVVCLPRNPACGACPLADKCIGRKQERVVDLPVKGRRPEVRMRYFNYLWIEDARGVRFIRRNRKDIWKGLYELPLVETRTPAGKPTLRRALPGATFERSAGPIDHVLSHQRIRALLWRARPTNGSVLPHDWEPVKRKAIPRLAVHRLMEKLLECMP